jgi:hypothetical protein
MQYLPQIANQTMINTIFIKNKKNFDNIASIFDDY